MKKMRFLPILLSVLLLAGCSVNLSEKPSQSEGPVKIGRYITAEAPSHLTLSENNDALAADGLYYATWTDGEATPYENNDGETVDLYDAQLYFLASEAATEEAAVKDCAAWLAAAKENYNVHSEEEKTYGEQTYTVISYDCLSDTSPYAKGMSAFATVDNIGVCIEFTCLKDYTKELEPILTEFIKGCHYSNQ